MSETPSPSLAGAMLPLLVLLSGAASGAVAGEPLSTRRVAGSFNDPVVVTHAPGDPDRLYVCEQRGVISVLRLDLLPTDPTIFLDLTTLVNNGGTEQGLLGMAFHLDYVTNGRFFVYYTGGTGSGETLVAEYHRSADPDVADAAADIILTYDQPTVFHNAGWMDFGNDGYLYIASGDGANTSSAQDLDTLLGKLLRIDVNGDDFPADDDADYAIPPTNPFVGVSGRDEIWAYGLRNPFRCGFDRLTGDLYISDVGNDMREEINFQPGTSTGGENYGWPCEEGTACVELTKQCACDDIDLVEPILDFGPEGCAVIGGLVYRGTDLPDLAGTYFWHDWCRLEYNTFRYVEGTGITEFTDRTDELDPPGSIAIDRVSSYGTDAAGELYLCEWSPQGEIFKVIREVCRADFNFDGAIDVNDLVILIERWGQCGGFALPCPGDADGDRFVDVDDIVELIQNWTAPERGAEGECAGGVVFAAI